MTPDRANPRSRTRAVRFPVRPVWSGATLVVVLVVAAMVAVSGAFDRDHSSAGRGGVSAADAFYVPPDRLPSGAPGTLIRSEPIPAPVGARGWKVLYHSRSVDGRDVAVSGVVYTPTGAAPAPGRDVVAYAHGTTGVADSCAPSKWPDPTVGIAGLESFLGAGYVVAQSDYEGLGTPGIHPYLVGVSEGRSVLDSARAAQHLDAHASDRVVVDGHSQGGHAALFAGQMAPVYAPDLRVLGISAGAPVTDVAEFLGSTRHNAGVKGFPMLAAAGYHAVYPDAPLRELFSRAAIDDIKAANRECDMNQHFAGARFPILIEAPAHARTWSALFRDNSPGHVRSSIPILVWQGDADPLVPAAATRDFVRRACALGDPVTELVYPGADHSTVVARARATVNTWIAARFAGTPAWSGCSATQTSVRS